MFPEVQRHVFSGVKYPRRSKTSANFQLWSCNKYLQIQPQAESLKVFVKYFSPCTLRMSTFTMQVARRIPQTSQTVHSNCINRAC